MDEKSRQTFLFVAVMAILALAFIVVAQNSQSLDGPGYDNSTVDSENFDLPEPVNRSVRGLKLLWKDFGSTLVSGEG
ncbi:MAG: hypothetical protein ABEJ95_00190 [Candidatus Nanohalobium sp.]